MCQQKEVCVFHQNDFRAHEVVLGNEKVCVPKQMKILGLIFHSKLNWYYQTFTSIEKANIAKQVLRIISKIVSTQVMKTALFLSRLYYGAKIWLTSALSATVKKNFGKHHQRC
jgi:hypothetical protein